MAQEGHEETLLEMLHQGLCGISCNSRQEQWSNSICPSSRHKWQWDNGSRALHNHLDKEVPMPLQLYFSSHYQKADYGNMFDSSGISQEMLPLKILGSSGGSSKLLTMSKKKLHLSNRSS